MAIGIDPAPRYIKLTVMWAFLIYLYWQGQLPIIPIAIGIGIDPTKNLIFVPYSQNKMNYLSIQLCFFYW